MTMTPCFVLSLTSISCLPNDLDDYQLSVTGVGYLGLVGGSLWGSEEAMQLCKYPLLKMTYDDDDDDAMLNSP